jgi:hypothetical protein
MSNGVQTVKLDYIPRATFPPFHNRSKRKTVIVAHRRAGKTYSVIQDLVARARRFPTAKTGSCSWVRRRARTTSTNDGSLQSTSLINISVSA